MIPYRIKTPFRTIAEQVSGIQHRYPNFKVVFSGQALRATGILRPTARSLVYTVEIGYLLKKEPDIWVLDPVLERNWKGARIEHTYDEKTLCLYHPLYGDFTYGDLLSETIIPWTSLWLYHYENWHMTGDWLGGGSHPTPNE